MTTTAEATVALDAAGRLGPAQHTEDGPPEALAAAACDAVHDLFGRQASVVSCTVTGQAPSWFAMAMLREQPAGTFLSSTALAENPGEAVVQAVLSALGIDDRVFPAAAKLWSAERDVHAVAVVDGDRVITPRGDDDELDAHVRLVQTLPAPGRLAVTTEDAEYRVLRFPAVALAVSTTPNAEALHEIDAWMAKAEAMGP